jgi:hypothetical protein
MKHGGARFANTTMIVGLHSPTMWIKSGAMQHPSKGVASEFQAILSIGINIYYYMLLDDLETHFLEQSSVELSDMLVSPSQVCQN